MSLDQDTSKSYRKTGWMANTGNDSGNEPRKQWPQFPDNRKNLNGLRDYLWHK